MRNVPFILALAGITLFGQLSAQTPGGVAGSVFWVKAGTGITIATNVSVWADQSGTSNNATQGVGANQPIFVNNDINFNPSVNFSLSPHLMTLTTPASEP